MENEIYLSIVENHEGLISRLDPGKGLIIISTRSFQKGEIIHTSSVIKDTNERDRWTIQIERNRHVLVSQPGRLFSHSCNPNMYIKVSNDAKFIDFIALKDIKEEEELTWNYCSAEDQFRYIYNNNYFSISIF